MWAEALRGEGVPVVLKSLGVGPGAVGNPVSVPHALYVLAPEEDRARALIPQEYQVQPAPEEDGGLPVPEGGEGFHFGVKTLIYLMCFVLMGLVLWLLLLR